MMKFFIFVVLGCVGGGLMALSHWQMKNYRASLFFSARAMHFIGMLLIFAGLVILVSQFLIYTKP